MVQGGILVIDNVTSHYEEVKPMLDMALQEPRVDSVVVPIGSGLLLCRIN